MSGNSNGKLSPEKPTPPARRLYARYFSWALPECPPLKRLSTGLYAAADAGIQV
jgi:hypothetical protein